MRPMVVSLQKLSFLHDILLRKSFDIRKLAVTGLLNM
jgi:hypothetical protein